MRSSGKGTLVGALAVLLATVACNDGNAPMLHALPREVQIIGDAAQSALRGDDAPSPLRVRVIGADSKPLSGASVRWTTEKSTATIEPASSTTDALGEASTHVNALAVTGPITVFAAVGKVPPVTFTITAGDPCLLRNAHPTRIDSVASGELRPFDCDIEDRYYDLYAFSLPEQQAVSLHATSSTFDAWVHAFDNSGFGTGSLLAAPQSGSVAMRIILPAGTNLMGVTSGSGLQTGRYTLTAEPASEDVADCGAILVAHQIITRQRLEPTDCQESAGERLHDSFVIFLWKGQRISLAESSPDFVPRLRLRDVNKTILADAAGNGEAPAQIDFTSQADGYYVILASSAALATGGYTLAVTEISSGGRSVTAGYGAASTTAQPRPSLPR